MTRILNLTSHTPTPEQIAKGVVQPREEIFSCHKDMLTFETIPSEKILRLTALVMAEHAKAEGFKYAMIDGPSYLIPHLVKELKEMGVTPLFSSTEKVSIEEPQLDGSVQKTDIFKHVKFTEC